jgi:hypothetical protein
MIRILFILALVVSTLGAESPLRKYKLILAGAEETQTVREKLFDVMLEDLAANLLENVKKLKNMSNEQILAHYGEMNSHSPKLDGAAAPASPETMRAVLAKKMETRSKEIARQIYAQMRNMNIEQLQQALAKTMETDEVLRNEAQKSLPEVSLSEVPEGKNAPSAPGYYPGYNGSTYYYNYYGYNYLYNYNNYNYRTPYPYYNNYSYYYPTYMSGNYYYNYRRYNRRYYNNYYYPTYNRSSQLLATGVFGLAAIGSFVDWLNN